ncbi:MAG TPA: capsular polysaccharide biosynthesis protein CapF [Rhodoferax sp.]
MKVLVTGANGFLGQNLRLRLGERKDVEVVRFTRGDDISQLSALVGTIDFVFHLAGVNRPREPQEFTSGNVDLTNALAQAVTRMAESTGRRIPIVYASSTQAVRDNPYGQSKRAAELALLSATGRHQIPVHIFRLPNVFGKWCKPNYNSAVATFCHNVARGLPIQINDPTAPLTLVYVDDVVQRFVELMDGADPVAGPDGFAAVAPQYTSTVGELARKIQAFKESRTTLVTDRVGGGLTRALYATYVSYLPVDSFNYDIPQYGDARGMFVEVLKTPDSGQFSFFTAHPGITRGGHYHHTKTEKFLVIKGKACFKFRHMYSGQRHELTTSGEKAEIVETVPGWTHDITNVGEEELVVVLWANEVFDRNHPDTFACPV